MRPRNFHYAKYVFDQVGMRLEDGQASELDLKFAGLERFRRTGR
jgi:hypothetical protein